MGQADDGNPDSVASSGLGDVYKSQGNESTSSLYEQLTHLPSLFYLVERSFLQKVCLHTVIVAATIHTTPSGTDVYPAMSAHK